MLALQEHGDAVGNEPAPIWGPVAGSGVAVLMPARDEGEQVLPALRSLSRQTLRPDLVLVVVNNSTDDTAALARQFSVEPGAPEVRVLVMPGHNPDKKAGALNYGLRELAGFKRGLLPPKVRYVLTMDGDTELHANFIERAVKVLRGNERLGGVSAAVHAKPRASGSRLLYLFQRIEYGRFAHSRIRVNVHTMSGAGSVYRAEALNQLIAARGEVFDRRSLVEDYEATLALKQARWKITTNEHVLAFTDVMPNLRMLLAQRTRWTRGTVDEWRRYGWCRATWVSICSMILGLAGLAYSALWITVFAMHLAHGGSFAPDPRFLALGGFWMLYQGWAARSLGWRIMLFEALILPETIFGFVHWYWVIKSIAMSYTSRAQAWAR